MNFYLQPGGRIQGHLTIPGDKSISHRALLLAALSEGPSELTGLLEGSDVLGTLEALRALEVPISGGGGHYHVRGVGMRGLRRPSGPLDLGNSGTAMRLMAGLLAAQTWSCELTGDDSLLRRPMQRIMTPLSRMGARIRADAGRPPLYITPGGGLTGINYPLPMASAQVKSAILLAGIYATGRTCVIEPLPTRDHTERALASFGYPVDVGESRVCLDGGGRLTGRTFAVPADLSSAAFFIVGALLSTDTELLLPGVGINPTRRGVLDILRRMGAQIEEHVIETSSAEPMADIHVRSSRLHGCTLDANDVALSIDEVPIIAIAAAAADGITEISGAGELRVKESDRIVSMVAGLQALGVNARARPDGMVIEGGEIGGGVIESAGDHRIAMAFSIASVAAWAPIEVRNCANVGTSFPGFATLAEAAGLLISQGE